MSGRATEVYRDRETAAFMVDDLLVYRDVGAQPPRSEPWSAYVAAVKRVTPRVQRCLIVPRAGGLTARQREEIRPLIGDRATAVLTASLANRCIITALAWFKVPLQAFAAGQYREALLWLGREHLLGEVQRGLQLFGPHLSSAALDTASAPADG